HRPAVGEGDGIAVGIGADGGGDHVHGGVGGVGGKGDGGRGRRVDHLHRVARAHVEALDLALDGPGVAAGGVAGGDGGPREGGDLTAVAEPAEAQGASLGAVHGGDEIVEGGGAIGEEVDRGQVVGCAGARGEQDGKPDPERRH